MTKFVDFSNPFYNLPFNNKLKKLYVLDLSSLFQLAIFSIYYIGTNINCSFYIGFKA